MLFWNKFLIFIFCLLIDFIKAEVLNIIAFTISQNGVMLETYVQGFNEYTKANNIDITAELALITIDTMANSLGNSYLMIESLLKKKSNKYDIYFYDVSYGKQYSPYLLDLREVLPEELINMYNKDIIDQICTYKDKLIGLPFSIWMDALFSNRELLSRYGKRVPLTWDELIETGKEIIKKEKELNNREIVGYNGYMFDSDNGLCSIYEFIYSCRESVDSPFPDLTSEAAVNAVKLIKKVKEELSSDEIFMSETVFSDNLFVKDALFVKAWTFYGLPGMENYIISNLPGIKEGISGTALIGYNIGIDSNIKDKKKESAIEAVKIMLSKEFQKNQVMKGLIISGMSSLYEDNEVCSNIIGCEIYNTVQPIAKPVDKIVNYIEYSEKFTSYFYNFLFGNKNNDTERSVLKKIDDITKIYKMHINKDETSVGLIFFVIYLVTFIVMFSSIILLFMKKYEPYFTFLGKFDWMMVLTGIFMILATAFTNYGDLSDFKCQLKNSLFSLGYAFINIPILCQLIIYFPAQNKYSVWVSKNKKLSFFTLILIDVLLNGLSLVKPYGFKNVILDEGLNFQICSMASSYIIVMNVLIIVYKCIITLVLLLLIFIEWNVQAIYMELKFVLSSIYVNIITFSLFIILSFFITNNYITYFLFQELIIYVISISNYIILYGIKLFLPHLYKKDEMDEILKNARVGTKEKKSAFSTGYSTQDTVKTGFSEVSKTSSTSSNTNSVYSKILSLHYSGGNTQII